MITITNHNPDEVTLITGQPMTIGNQTIIDGKMYEAIDNNTINVTTYKLVEYVG